MKPRNRKRYALLTMGMLLLCLSLAGYLWIRKEQQQYALNRQLIDALMIDNTKSV